MQYELLQETNDKLRKAGKPLIVIKPADKYLLEDDLVEMVNAGLLPTAWALRKNNPQLRSVDGWLRLPAL